MQENVSPERLATAAVFGGLSEAQMARVAEAARLLRAPLGHVVVEEGDFAAKFFVILEGAVTVHRAGHHLVDLGPGDFFGEVGTMTCAPRNASVIATTPVEVAVIMGWDLREMLDDLPSLRAKLEAASVERKPAS